MANHPANEFDFDDWAGLYLENPQEFEARRQAALMIEMAKGNSEQAAACRELLDAFDQRVQGCNTAERLQVAAQMMADSAQQMSTELMLVKQNLESAISGDSSDTAVILEKIMAEDVEQ